MGLLRCVLGLALLLSASSNGVYAKEVTIKCRGCFKAKSDKFTVASAQKIHIFVKTSKRIERASYELYGATTKKVVATSHEVGCYLHWQFEPLIEAGTYYIRLSGTPIASGYRRKTENIKAWITYTA